MGPRRLLLARSAGAVALLLLLTGAGGRGASTLITGVPHVRQEPDFCGEACVAMALRKLGHAADQRDVFERTGVDPGLGRGAYTPELKVAVERLGFRPGPVWFQISPDHAEQQMDAQLEALRADLARSVPSIVCMHADGRRGAPEHFRLVLGYDATTDEIVYHEPAEDHGAYRRMPRARFVALWPLKYHRDEWTVVRIALDPAFVTAPARAPGVTAAAQAQHVMSLKRQARIPPGFTTAVTGPFLVIGDEEPAGFRHHTHVVEWTTNLLQADFGMTPPTEIIDVWLFGSSESYTTNVERLYGAPPTTPYGFFYPSKRALLMNIATGGGTLIHELVHPFIATNFPEAPPWFNEGLASLYERVVERDGHLWGLPNWRLDGLKRAVRTHRLPSFEALTASESGQFYSSPTGYAHARYLCLYLQEKGLLRRYYAEFRAAAKSDPTGYTTLVRVLGGRMTRFQHEWETWVLSLAPPSDG